jgi:hypothetical protein
MTHYCLWILSHPNEWPVRHCRKPVSYTMTRDDDNNSVRKYRTFCDEHQQKVDEQEAADDENQEA